MILCIYCGASKEEAEEKQQSADGALFSKSCKEGGLLHKFGRTNQFTLG
jgi:hypothetical protein